MLKLQKELFLVVLNGCPRAGQVERLLQEGIPAVTATQRPVDDQRVQETDRYDQQARGTIYIGLK
jgi:hypothetical protein